MLSPDGSERELEILSLLKANIAVTEENNRLLKKMHRNAVVEMWLRVLWYAFLIGLPLALYFYILEPYLKPIEKSFEQIRLGTFPGAEVFQEMMKRQQKR